MDFVAASLELLGLYLIGNKAKWGFLFAIAALSVWIYVAVTRDTYGLILIAVPGIVMNTRNFFKWRAEEAKTPVRKTVASAGLEPARSL
jgi:nicotinamide riboside transporter PnuC